ALSDSSFQVSGKTGENAIVEIDPATALPRKLTFQSIGMRGPGKFSTAFSEWKDLNGIKSPSRVIIEQDGSKFGEGSMESVQFNTGLTLEQLSKKE
ncbi:MAG: hypothetical protein WKF37_21850, partial [Bryobacteraceae bacterium]